MSSSPPLSADQEELALSLAKLSATENARAELAAIESELRRRRYKDDPELWYREKVKGELWSGQQRILKSVATNRKTAVRTCHEIGKSYISASIASWWGDTDTPGDSFIVTSAPSGPQVKAILWREIARVHAIAQLPGRLNKTEWYLPVPPDGHEELIAYGRKPDEYDFTAFQGIHARRVLVIFDEACGIHGPLWEAAASLTANDLSKVLVIGNPDDPSSEFAELCTPGSGYNVIDIGAFDTPNFTGEPVSQRLGEMLIGRTYVEEMRLKHARKWVWTEDKSRVVPPPGKTFEEAIMEAGPFWCSKVLGIFPPKQGEDALIPLAWILQAMKRELPVDPSRSENQLGVDVGSGGDSSTVAHRRGPVVRIVHEDHNPNTMQTCGKVIELKRSTNASRVKVDSIGIGTGLCDRSDELAKDPNEWLDEPFIRINVGEAASDPAQFLNQRAENYWDLRTRFEHGDVDLEEDDHETAMELAAMRFKRTSGGKIQIESKAELKRRIGKSPNRGEAVMLAFAEPVEEPVENKLTGGAL